MEKARNSAYDARSFGFKLAAARKAHREAAVLACDVRIWADWMRKDILSLAGPSMRKREHLYDFVVEELDKRKNCIAALNQSARRSKTIRTIFWHSQAFWTKRLPLSHNSLRHRCFWYSRR
jgi:hypothetical protein